MSKMGQYIFQMQEDAIELSVEQFEAQYGKSQLDLRDQILAESYGPDYQEAFEQEMEERMYERDPSNRFD